MRIAGEESEASWGEVLQGLVQRRVFGVPMLAVVDGNPGLRAALHAGIAAGNGWAGKLSYQRHPVYER